MVAPLPLQSVLGGCKFSTNGPQVGMINPDSCPKACKMVVGYLTYILHHLLSFILLSKFQGIAFHVSVAFDSTHTARNRFQLPPASDNRTEIFLIAGACPFRQSRCGESRTSICSYYWRLLERFSPAMCGSNSVLRKLSCRY